MRRRKLALVTYARYFGQTVAALREKKDTSVDALASRSGLPYEVVAEIELGSIDAGLSEVYRFTTITRRAAAVLAAFKAHEPPK